MGELVKIIVDINYSGATSLRRMIKTHILWNNMVPLNLLFQREDGVWLSNDRSGWAEREKMGPGDFITESKYFPVRPDLNQSIGVL